ncbi:MAG TPA: EF-hand domain-containing protein [Candidatus Poseidoniaceae archaeon]|nr:EF-hand domain-containing protein [Candidatus Poseidoniaceae archaeon]
MSDETNEEIAMAECGACRAIVPLNSESCPECSISFSGVSDDALGECGACKGLVPLDSTKCTHCGTIFVADDVVEVLRKWLSETGITIPILFTKFDKDGDGRIDSSELKSGLLSLKLADLPPSQVERLIETIDEDGDGQIDLAELHETITGEKYFEDSKDISTKDSEVEESEDEGEESKDESNEEESDDESDDEESDDEEEEESDDESDDEEEEESDEESADEEEDESDDEEEEESDDEEEDESDDELEDIDDIIDEIDEDVESKSILQLISDAMDESGDSPNKFFNSLDKDGNGNVSVEEFTSAIEGLIGEDVSSKDIESFLVNTDDDGDGDIDIIEFVSALELLDDADDAVDDDTRLSPKVDKPFPTDMQKKMMGKQWNDVVWPLIHMVIGLFIAAWLINAMGGIGPLSVDGTGGNVELESKTGLGLPSQGLYDGDIYPCDPEIQVGDCRNSLTPFSGDSSSMPAGFYFDGILMMVLGGLGLTGSLIMHFMIVPGWRARAKAMKEVEDDTEDARSEDSEDDEDETEDDEESDDEEEDSDEEDEESEDEDDEEEDSDEEAGDDDDIDIGSHIGLTFDDEEVFGVIVEFDDDEETVTIEEDGTGDLVTGYQEDMFLE